MNNKKPLLLMQYFLVYVFSLTICMSSSIPAHSGKIDGLIGAWSFDEGTGNTAMDISGNGHDGAIRNAVWTDGIFGQGLKFGPVDSAVMIPNPDAFSLNTFTIVGWVKCEMQDNFNQVLVAKSDGRLEGINYVMEVLPKADPSNAGCANFHIGFAKIKTGVIVSDGKWHHMALTHDDVGMLIGYVDGKVAGRNESKITGSSNVGVSIGATNGGSSSWMNGSLDDIAVFDYALSSDELGELIRDSIQMYINHHSVDMSSELPDTWGRIKNVGFIFY